MQRVARRMHSSRQPPVASRLRVALAMALMLASTLRGAEGRGLRAGFAARDITPTAPLWLNGYSARNRPSERVDSRLLAQAAAFEDASGKRFVLVALDNCEVDRAFSRPVLKGLQERFSLPEGTVAVVSSHTHSAPCLSGVLTGMFELPGQEAERLEAYTARLQGDLVEVVGEALADLRPARLHRGLARAGFAMNRRVFREDRVDFGENPEGPVDHEVPVLRVSSPEGAPRAIVFGYACHGTTVAGDDFYAVSPDFMGYAREHLESAFPGARALFLTGCGADANPSPRGSLALARRHGLELAGAVAGALSRPLREVGGPITVAYARLALPLAPPPTREKLLEDSGAREPAVRTRARSWLKGLESGANPATVDLPLACVRLGEDLTFILIGGEVVVDYALRLKRELAALDPWVVGYAYEVPCYIPSARILREGGYEAEGSLAYYGIYGPLLGRCEQLIVARVKELAETGGGPQAK